MSANDAIVNPFRGKNSPVVAPVSIMVSSSDDLRNIVWQSGLKEDAGTDLYISRLYVDKETSPISFTAVGPFIGAPYGVMLLETLIAWGAKQVVFFGWCGAISPRMRIGDVLVPTGAFIDEGTSRHYHQDGDGPVRPSSRLNERIKAALKRQGHAFHEGDVWTTDAIYRETPEKVDHFHSRNAIAVEMELSAVLSVGHFRNIEVGAILIVSDELSSSKWQPGFGYRRFRTSRNGMCRTMGMICQELNDIAVEKM